MARKSKKGTKRVPWTQREEDILIENVRKNVTNLKKAFLLTSKEVQRTPKAITAHWYSRTSIQSGHCLFMTISGKHIAINRKNGRGKKSSLPLYKKVLAIFGLSY